MLPTVPTCEFTDITLDEYALFRDLIYAKSGIRLGDNKVQLVRGRLGKIVREGGYASFHDYYHRVEQDATGRELCRLLDAISTNTTHLFREMRHFQLLGELIRGWIADPSWRAANRTLRIWSAACSSGEEPHSIAMTARDALQECSEIELKILATDISTNVLSRAGAGIYPAHRVGTVPPEFRNRYLRTVDSDDGPAVAVSDEIRSAITFSRFNLIRPSYPFRNGFHVIFCRNVMIYFDRPTTQSVVQRLAQHLLPGGVLMIGHSESLTGVEHPLEYAEPTVYRRANASL